MRGPGQERCLLEWAGCDGVKRAQAISHPLHPTPPHLVWQPSLSTLQYLCPDANRLLNSARASWKSSKAALSFAINCWCLRRSLPTRAPTTVFQTRSQRDTPSALGCYPPPCPRGPNHTAKRTFSRSGAPAQHRRLPPKNVAATPGVALCGCPPRSMSEPPCGWAGVGALVGPTGPPCDWAGAGAVVGPTGPGPLVGPKDPCNHASLSARALGAGGGIRPWNLLRAFRCRPTLGASAVRSRVRGTIESGAPSGAPQRRDPLCDAIGCSLRAPTYRPCRRAPCPRKYARCVRKHRKTTRATCDMAHGPQHSDN